MLQHRIVMPILLKEANYDNKAAKAPGSVAIGSGASVAFEDKTEKAMVLVRVLQLVRMRQ